MEPRGFWDERAKEFLKLLDDHEGRDLTATVTDDGWVINEGDTAPFKYVFESLATQAAKGGDLVAADEDPVDAWLNRLRQGPHFTEIPGSRAVVDGVAQRSTGGGFLNCCLCLASADSCVSFRTNAPGKRSGEVSASLNPATSGQGSPEVAAADTLDSKSYPMRAAWFKSLLKKPGVTKNRLNTLGGPARKTMTRIESGLPVTENSLDKLAMALSEAGVDVTFRNIPQD